jgi:myosin heavy subunit
MENISREDLALVAQQLENELASKNAEIAMLKSKIQSQAEMMDAARKEIVVVPHLNASLMNKSREVEELRRKNEDLVSELRRVRSEAVQAQQAANTMATNAASAAQDVMRAMMSQQQENLSGTGGEWGSAVRGMTWGSSSSNMWGNREPFQQLHEPNMFATPLDSMEESTSSALIDEILTTWVEEIFNDFGEAVLLTKISSEVIKRAEHYHMPLSDPNEWKMHVRSYFSTRPMQFDIADAHTGSQNGSILVKRKM